MSDLPKFLARNEHQYVYTDSEFVIISSAKLPKETQEENDIRFVGLAEDVTQKFVRDKKVMLDSAFEECAKGLYYHESKKN